MIAATPRSNTDDARVNLPAAVAAMKPPRMTMAILI